MLDLSIEYCHTYTDREFSTETVASVALLQQHLLTAPASRQLLVLIDDYSPAQPDTFDYPGFLARLDQHGSKPDMIVKESALLALNQQTLAAIQQPRLRRQLQQYIASHERHPCSLFVASWYLARLGLTPADPACPVTPARRLLNILPERFREYEDRALDIIAAVAGRAVLDRVETVYFPPPVTALADPLWDRFDPEAYLFNNYLTLLPADLYVLAATYRRYRAHAPLDWVLDLGTGPGLFPVLAVLPCVQHVTIIEPGARNRDYLLGQQRSLDPAWSPALAVLRLLDPALAAFDFQAAFRDRVTIHAGDHRDLPRAAFAAVAMHYVAESATTDREEFAAICQALTNAARPQALVTAAFMEGSTGYTVDTVPFPALPVTANDVAATFSPLLTDWALERLDRSSGPARHGYTGHLLLTGKRAG